MNDQTATNRSYGALPLTPPDALVPPDALEQEPRREPGHGTAPEPTPKAPDGNGARPSRFGRRQTGQKAARTAQESSDEDDLTPTRKRRRVTRLADSGRMPALRLNRYVGRERAERQAPAMVYDTEHAPAHLRLTRLALGLALLALAWAASLLVVVLTESLVDVFPNQASLTMRFALYVLGALGLIWLAVVALALIIVGAFSLMLAFTRRAW